MKQLTKKQQQKIELLKELKNITSKIKDKRLCATITRVSNSGMSRCMRFFYQDKKTGYLYDITWKINNILGYTWTDEGMRVGGCGMDMIFHVLYSLNSLAKSYKVIKISKNKTSHDLYYNGIVNTSYNRL